MSINPVLQNTASNLLMANLFCQDQPHAQLFDNLCDLDSNGARRDTASPSSIFASSDAIQDGVSDLVAPEASQEANHLLEMSSVNIEAREELIFKKAGEVRGKEAGESTIRANIKENDSANSDDSITKDESVHLDKRRKGDAMKSSGAFSAANDDCHDIWNLMELDPEFQSSDTDEIDMGEFDTDKVIINVDERSTSPSMYLSMPLLKLPVHMGALDVKSLHAHDASPVILGEFSEVTNQALFYDPQEFPVNSTDEDAFSVVRPVHTSRARNQTQETKRRYSGSAETLQTNEALSQTTNDASGSSNRCLTFPQNRQYLEKLYESMGATELIQSIVKRELDAEIEMRKKEIEQIEFNLTQVKVIWEKLQRIWSTKVFSEEMIAHRIVKSEDETSVGKRTKHRSRSNTGLVHLEKNGGQPKKKKKIEPLPQKLLYYRTPSNGFVQLICPACSRELFGNQLGFINHCRMVHQLKFVTLDDAAEVCGKPVDESCVPEDDPSRHEITLGYFVGQKTMCTQNQAKSGSLAVGQAEESEFTQRKEGGQDGGQTRNVSSRNEYSEASEANEPSLDYCIGSDTATVSDDVLKQAKVEFSRFYIKKQLLLGNTSKPLRLSSGETLFKWLVYLRPLRGDVELEKYIDKVRFFLHPSFKPRNIVEISNPPFHLLRESLHPWPVRVQIYFRDPRNKPLSVIHYLTFHNATLEALGDETVVDLEINRKFMNNMKLWSEPNPRWPKMKSDEKGELFRDEDGRIRNNKEQGGQTGFGMDLAKCSDSQQTSHNDSGICISSADINGNSLKSVVIEQANRTYPLINSDERCCLPYSTAKSEEEWMSWSHAKRKASEWQRARHLRVLLDEKYNIKCKTYQMLELCQLLNLVPPHKQANRPQDPFSDPYSYERLYMLPILRARLEEIETLEYKKISKKINYCRYCGCLHLPIHRFDELEQECGEKKIWILEECHSSFEEYLEKTYKWMSEEKIRTEKQLEFKRVFTSFGNNSNISTSESSLYSKFKSRVDISASGLVYPTLDLSLCSEEQKRAQIGSPLIDEISQSAPPIAMDAEFEEILPPNVKDKTDLANSKNVGSNFNSSDAEKNTRWKPADPDSSLLPLPTLFNLSSPSSNAPYTGHLPLFSPEQISLLSSTLPESTCSFTSPCSLKPKKRGRPTKKAAVCFFDRSNYSPSAFPQFNSPPIFVQNSLPTSPLLESNSSTFPTFSCADRNHSIHEQLFGPANISPCSQRSDPSSPTIFPYLPLFPLLRTPSLTFRPYHLDASTSQLLCPLLCIELEHTGIDLALHPFTQHLLLKLLGCFCRKLLLSSALVYNEERSKDSLHERKCKVLVGLHVVAAILRDPKNFDFLTSEGLAKYTSRQIAESGYLEDNPHQTEILNQLAQRNSQNSTQNQNIKQDLF